MARPPIVEGQTATNPSTGDRIIYRGGKWTPLDNQSAPADAPAAPMTPGADSRVRLSLGFGPAVTAQRGMDAAETAGGERTNPLNSDWGAATLDAIPDWGLLSPTARVVGGEDYQRYTQAAKSFEAAVLPVLSGAAVTDSEASRQIRANLPELGDTPQTLERKALNRSMMLNVAADLLGRPRPFPKVGTWDGGEPALVPSGNAPYGGVENTGVGGLTGGGLNAAAPQPATAASPSPATPRNTGDPYTNSGTRGRFVRYADMTPEQAAAARSFANSTARWGDRQRPFVTRTEADYNGLPPGAWYIFTNGSIQQKPAGRR